MKNNNYIKKQSRTLAVRDAALKGAKISTIGALFFSGVALVSALISDATRKQKFNNINRK